MHYTGTLMIARKRFAWRTAGPGLALLAILIGGQSSTAVKAGEPEKKEEYFQGPGEKVSNIIRARGYLAKEYAFLADDGYVLGMTRGLNPLIGPERRRHLNRKPLLFIHGTIVDGNSFVANSFELKQPKDFSRVEAERLSESELIDMFGEEPSAKSLAFFALDFGHEVWFLHRRGAQLSQRRVELPANYPKPPTVMEKYLKSVEAFNRRGRTRRRKLKTRPWRRERSAEFATADQSEVLKSSARELNTVDRHGLEPGQDPHELTDKQLGKTPAKKNNSKLGQAAKAAPAALLDDGNFAKDIKVTHDKRLWNHSFDEQAAYDLPRAVDYVLEKTGHERLAIVGDSSGGALIMMSLILEPTLNDKLSKAIAWVPSFNIGHKLENQSISLLQPLFDYIGPFPLTFLAKPSQALMEFICGLEVAQVAVCSVAADAQLGQSGGQVPLRPEFQSHYLTPVSAHEYLQLIQFISARQTRMFDFRDKQKNLLAYGQLDPPYYNVSLISFEYLSIYAAINDNLVSLDDIKSFQQELVVPHRVRIMDEPGANHAAVLYHNKVSSITILPTYKDIISHGYKGR